MNFSGWRKPLTWVGAAAFVFLGSRIPLVGLDVESLVRFFNRQGSGGGLLGLYELLSQGGLRSGAVLALGIMPYLSARVVLWLWGHVRAGDARLPQDVRRRRTRWITAGLALTQSAGFTAFLHQVPGAVTTPGTFTVTTIVTLTAASLVAMWFGEQLTETDEEPEIPLSEMLGRPEASPALPEPGLPASQRLHPHPSSVAETPRTRR